jgi:hypothetical protein
MVNERKNKKNVRFYLRKKLYKTCLSRKRNRKKRGIVKYPTSGAGIRNN